MLSTINVFVNVSMIGLMFYLLVFWIRNGLSVPTPKIDLAMCVGFLGVFGLELALKKPHSNLWIDLGCAAIWALNFWLDFNRQKRNQLDARP